jgi:hypothetical protein
MSKQIQKSYKTAEEIYDKIKSNNSNAFYLKYSKDIKKLIEIYKDIEKNVISHNETIQFMSCQNWYSNNKKEEFLRVFKDCKVEEIRKTWSYRVVLIRNVTIYSSHYDHNICLSYEYDGDNEGFGDVLITFDIDELSMYNKYGDAILNNSKHKQEWLDELGIKYLTFEDLEDILSNKAILRQF